MKALIYIGIFVGGLIGSYVPVLFGQSAFSFASILAGGAGSLVGIWAGYKLGQNM